MHKSVLRTLTAFSLFLLVLLIFTTNTFAFAPTPTPIAGAVQATVTADSLRVRSGPGTDFGVLGSLAKGDFVQILARNADSTWWQIAYPDTSRRGWVSAQFISPGGATDLVPTANPTSNTSTPTKPAVASSSTLGPRASPTSQATPTETATPTPSPTPTDTATPTPSSTPTDIPTLTLTPTLTPTVTITPSPGPSNTPTATPTPPGRDPKRALFVTGTDQIVVSRSKVWYRYEYLGDRSPIMIAVDGFGVKDLDVLIYTPDQVDGNFNEPKTQAVGRGGGNRAQTGHDVFWTGAFPSGGTAYVAVVNNTNRAIIFRLSVTGVSVITTPFQIPSSADTASPEDNSTAPGIRVETSVGSRKAPIATLPSYEIDTGEVRANRLKWLRDFYTLFGGTAAAQAAPTSNEPTGVYTILYPGDLGIPPLALEVVLSPAQCTPPDAIGVVITQSIKLCPNTTYRPLNLSGSRIGIFQDDANTALVKSDGRSFAITAVGDHVLLQGLKVQATTDPQDRGKWVCAFSRCKFGDVFVEGGPVYGGGISISGSNMVVKDVTVTGGTIGVALLEGADNFLINNKLLYQTGWASYNRYPQRTQFLGNQFNFANRDCRGPDGAYYSQGCETAGWICISCVDILLLNNECKRGGNCYYVSGDGGTPSYNVKFIGNTCYAAPNNCFEATFSKGIYFERNLAKKDPYTGENCNYPFWVGGSEVVFGKGNDWACLISANTAKIRSDGASPSPGGSGDPADKPDKTSR